MTGQPIRSTGQLTVTNLYLEVSSDAIPSADARPAIRAEVNNGF